MTTTARIELKDLEIQTQIGTYAPGAVIPKQHLLDLTLWINPLVVEIDNLAADGHYETQERLMSRIVQACTQYPEIESLEIGLRKLPVRAATGSLGVRLYVDQETLASLRASSSLS